MLVKTLRTVPALFVSFWHKQQTYFFVFFFSRFWLEKEQIYISRCGQQALWWIFFTGCSYSMPVCIDQAVILLFSESLCFYLCLNPRAQLHCQHRVITGWYGYFHFLSGQQGKMFSEGFLCACWDLMEDSMWQCNISFKKNVFNKTCREWQFTARWRIAEMFQGFVSHSWIN